MLNRHLINLTPHDINVRMTNEDAFFTIAPTGVVARCDTEYNTVDQINAMTLSLWTPQSKRTTESLVAKRLLGGLLIGKVIDAAS